MATSLLLIALIVGEENRDGLLFWSISEAAHMGG